jgi:sulfotransferase family protein
MIYGIKKIVRYALGTDIAGRTLAVRPDDTFIVSYPRSGNTWTRFLIANLLHPDKAVTFANIEELIPDAEAQSSRYMKRVPSPRVIKSHQYFDHRYRKVIYIVRDPRDVVVSYYQFARKYRSVQDGSSLESFVSDFVRGRLSSASWGTWGENVSTWTAARHGQESFLLLRYEDLIAGATIELKRLAQFLGIDVTLQHLLDAVNRSSADRMRDLEKSQSDTWVSTKNKRNDIPFIGPASTGNWKAKLTDRSVEEIESAWGALMVQVGYELSTKTAQPLRNKTGRPQLSVLNR